MPVDVLAAWWVHEVTVKPRLRTGLTGQTVYGAEYPQTGFYLDGYHEVAGPAGEQAAASGRLKYPAAAPFIPLGSQLTLPGKFGSRVVTVVATAVGDGGPLPTPDHQEVSVR